MNNCITAHTVVIYDRGGTRRVFQPRDISQLSWERTLNEISNASITITGEACRAQEENLANIQVRRHELVIFRGGERVWEGPITDISYYQDSVTISARDILEYLDGTIMANGYESDVEEGTGSLRTRAQNILNKELRTAYNLPGKSVSIKRWEGLNPPANIYNFLDIRPMPNLKVSMITDPFEMMVGEHLRSLTDYGLNFTVLGRSLILWDSAESLGEVRRLSQKDIPARPEIVFSGVEYASIVHVASSVPDWADGADLEHVGSAGNNSDYYGAWTRLVSAVEQDPDDDRDLRDALNSQAETIYEKVKVPPIKLSTPSGGSINMSESLTISMLVPGAKVPVVALVRGINIDRTQILSQVSVTDSAGGESVGITLESGEN